MAQLQALIKNLPELIEVAASGQPNIREIDGDHPLVEAAVIFGFTVLVQIGRQEGTAPHAGVAVTVTIGVHLVLQHLLLADVVRHQTLDGALGAQLGQVVVGRTGLDVVLLQHIDELGEGGSDPDTLLILHALHALLHGFLNNHGEVMLGLGVADLIEVHEHSDERSLSVCSHQRDDLILDGLDATLDFFPDTPLCDFVNSRFSRVGEIHQLPMVNHVVGQLELLLNLLANLLPGDIHKGGEVCKGDRLAAVLVGGDLGDDLGGNVARRAEGVRLLNQGAGDNRAVLEHILQVDQTAVVHMLDIVVAVVEVDDAFFVGFGDFLRQEKPLSDIPAQLARYVVTLGGQNRRILVGILLDNGLVDVICDGKHLTVQCAGVPHKLMLVAVLDVRLGDGVHPLLHQLGFDIVLNLLHRDCPVEPFVPERKSVGQPFCHIFLVFDGMKVVNFAQCPVRSVTNLGFVEVDFAAISFNDDHNARPPL